MIALNDVAKLMGRYMQLHPVAAFYLEGNIVGCGSMMMVHISRMVMVGNIGTLGHNGRVHRQPGGVVIVVPLLEAADKGE